MIEHRKIEHLRWTIFCPQCEKDLGVPVEFTVAIGYKNQPKWDDWEAFYKKHQYHGLSTNPDEEAKAEATHKKRLAFIEQYYWACPDASFEEIKDAWEKECETESKC